MIIINIPYKNFRKLSKRKFSKWYKENEKGKNIICLLRCEAMAHLNNYYCEIKFNFDNIEKTFEIKITKDQFKELLNKVIEKELNNEHE